MASRLARTDAKRPVLLDDIAVVEDIVVKVAVVRGLCPMMPTAGGGKGEQVLSLEKQLTTAEEVRALRCVDARKMK